MNEVIVKKFTQPTKRFCQMLDLKNDPKLIEEYVNRHQPNNVWQEVLHGLQTIGVLEMEIYLADNHLFMIIETPVDFDFDTAFQQLANLPRQQEWENYMSCFQQADPHSTAKDKWKPMQRIFHLYEQNHR